MIGTHQADAYFAKLERTLPDQVTDPKWDGPMDRSAFLGTIRTQLLPFITCGDQADRGVDDNLARAIYDFKRGWGSEALYWLGLACSEALKRSA
jgi:hypothetical protein